MTFSIVPALQLFYFNIFDSTVLLIYNILNEFNGNPSMDRNYN